MHHHTKFNIFGIWNIIGIFQKYSSISQFLLRFFWCTYVIFSFLYITTFCWSLLEYWILKKKESQHKKWYFWKMEYSRNIPKKYNHNQNIGTSGIWNIPWNNPGIFKKKYHNWIFIFLIWKNLEYGLLHGIFLEYSKKASQPTGA